MAGFLLDANLLLLLVIGTADPRLVAAHKRLSGFSAQDVVLLNAIVEDLKQIVIVPNVVTEVSNLIKQFAGPAKGTAIDLAMAALRLVIETASEIYVPSLDGADRTEFRQFGLTDAVLVALLESGGQGLTLLTVDGPLFNRANALGFDVIDYRQLR